MQPQSETLHFGRFRLEPKRRLLFADEATVALSSRAYDILELLVRCHDRIVSRDEIVAHVWHGMVVGENNLAVQMSALRRALSEHASGELLIVNLPGRGYQFVADVTEIKQMSAVAESPAPIAAVQEPPPPIGRARWIGWLVAGLAVLVTALLALVIESDAWHGLVSEVIGSSYSSMPEARLSIAIPHFAALGEDHRTAALATHYTDAMLSRFGQFEDLVLYSDPEMARSRLTPHFRLTGTVEIIGAEAVLTIGLTETLNGRHLYRDSRTLPVAASVSDRLATALEVLVAIRPIVFQAEAARRKGAPRDALDFLIAAHQVLGPATQLAQLRQAGLLVEQAVRLDPSNRAARSLLAFLMAEDMLLSGAGCGDDKGRRALTIIDSVLREQPRNPLYLYRRVYILAALDRLDDAQATAELGLQIEPGYQILIEKLGEIVMMKGDVATAKILMKPDANDTQDDTLATIAFIEERYADTLVMIRSVVAATPTGSYTPFNILLEISTLGQLNRTQEAKSLLRTVLPELPSDLRFISAQRQATYILPDRAWRQFKQGLLNAGMTP